MILLELLGGAGQGNQLFMFSRAYALAKETNQKITILFCTSKERIKNRPYILDKFNIDKDCISHVIKLGNKNKIIRSLIVRWYRILYKNVLKANSFIEEEQKHRIFVPMNNLNSKHYYLYGYFESFKYSEKYRDDLIKQFTPNYELNETTKQLLNEIKSCNSIALHIRRGDFVLEGKDAGTEYYKKQMDKARKEIENPVFYLATIDDKIIEEFRKYKDVRIIDTTGDNKDINDWLCLKECKHHIIANSTYSWWAAYLSDYENKKIYMPTLEEYESFEKRDFKREYNDFYWKEY